MTAQAHTAQAFDDWVAEARAVPLVAYARRLSPTLKRSGRDMVGPCPACKGTDRFSIALHKDVWFCRRFGAGGDVIALARHVEDVDFVGACEALTGRPPPGRDSTDTPDARAARETAARARHAAAAADAARRARDETERAYAEQRRAWRIWRDAGSPTGTPAEAYLRLRGLDVPAEAHLRYAPDHPLYTHRRQPDGRYAPFVVHRGPALIGRITGSDGQFAGVHATWIDLSDPDGKARIVDPETGRPLPSKKVRGTVHGARIELVPHPAPDALFMGEGNETSLSAFQALARRGSPLVKNAALWAGVSLGNMAGRSIDRVPHPTLREDGREGDRPKMVAGILPDRNDVVLPIPPSVRRLTWLGDGDSDRFSTECALRRAAARHDRPGLEQFIAWAEPGRDFNDMLRGAA